MDDLLDLGYKLIGEKQLKNIVTNPQEYGLKDIFIQSMKRVGRWD